MRRRDFITLLGGTAALPLPGVCAAVERRQSKTWERCVADGYALQLTTFRQGLKEAGFVEGQNVGIEYRWAEGQYDRLSAMATESG